MASVVHKIFFPGFAPYLQAKALQLPLSDRVKKVISHPAGPFTIHFWAPALKWGICLANLADMKTNKVENTSVAQQSAVALTGIIWARYSTVITPKNWSLFSVNVFMAITGSLQLYRVFMHHLAEKEKASSAAPSS
ncbi:WD-40 repeat protein [Toxoplasma gondii TgCatPRC2]|uniref:Mitochondrial pyruvate carrier n=15 Tax=Toxoplasma gondii TaxID=5811 RepID=B9PU32_TOXGV|nr:WD-40 repeat protein [Toxoplasma gondii ME49]EPR61487.1 WD-40 repeat protein [Toxoplasma gondii GT1]ESS33149.1 WD-40 repeat protein [Toxoplasma gondii VEG]KAF4642749.1 WD-40 repeat protein [Toxoplasma gondii]KFG38105.1 WD-40 repeat protein [Toxoplasma gondii GAB2-2007-GAL-DOM2]KFG39640.1 WD-40 repeat protein [Toxoplasma gondii FOU]KFG46428.1 WD-40 repeat protein [Toxoplasma gondii p89]KFH02067.1 WD-40 repeat protein [Toxoplasma gondii MAS]KFH07304.1 WD-40 repeat protein [Toxoplasma gondi|eukprot:XP_002367709.1 WD-40 repeat protein [Toxoplasma gondii ME49]